MDQKNQEDKETCILRIEEQFKTVLNPVEPWIMRAQSLLVWENPKRSAVLFICVHGLFWYVWMSTLHLTDFHNVGQ